MFWFKLIRDFISILREGQTPAQVAGGFALGSILGLSPMLTLQGVLVWLIILVIDVNLSAALVALTSIQSRGISAGSGIPLVRVPDSGERRRVAELLDVAL